MSSVKIFTSLLISAVAGAAIGALFSSGSSDKKRKATKDANDLKESIKEGIEELAQVAKRKAAVI